MTKTERNRIVSIIAADTRYDAGTIRFHGDGTITAVEDADKTCSGPHSTRMLVGRVADFADGANPFRAPEPRRPGRPVRGAEPVQSYHIKLEPATAEAARAIGEGNLSRGIAAAVKAYAG